MERTSNRLILCGTGPVRPLTRLTVDATLNVAPDLIKRYQNGHYWLERRLDDLAHNRAYAMGIATGSHLIALALLTPKGAHAVKLSTFSVAPRFRSAGIGRTLLQALRCKWLADDIDRVHVTVDQDDFSTTQFFLNSNFAQTKDVLVNYGEHRWDKVLSWTPAADSRAPAFFR
ncbi:GNAT family N-acetyltransferase [Sphingomonas sp. TF3]|uniref:GNAT family N-acetyltransferase n=1 Tax=Sphingomonas sp. TF3 TaxID=2495580 RepID=UPI000F868116|nr:GNAT family N-acetyltransferase [Sphingomonas sp. TF3]RUN76457.1 GNAT family N-acetyltransferase [Sphingomonas sp. TF3]